MRLELIAMIVIGVACVGFVVGYLVWFPAPDSRNYCEDLNKWCNCWNGKMMCDLNMAVECDYLCEATTTVVGAGYVGNLRFPDNAKGDDLK